MNGEYVWEKIIAGLSEIPIEIATVPSNNRTPLWFSVYLDRGNIYVDNAIMNIPSTRMTGRRKIRKNDFLTVYQFYDRWNNGERKLRQEVRTLSRNTAYIFGLIDYFKK